MIRLALKEKVMFCRYRPRLLHGQYSSLNYQKPLASRLLHDSFGLQLQWYVWYVLYVLIKEQAIPILEVHVHNFITWET